MIVWTSLMEVACLLNGAVELHYMVNFGIWVDQDLNTNVRLVKNDNFKEILTYISRRVKLLVVK